MSINLYAYNIDSAVCSECGNCPFLAPALHRSLDYLVVLQLKPGSPDYDRRVLHAFKWMTQVGSSVGQARLEQRVDDPGQAHLLALWERTIMARALSPESEREVAALIERSELDFGSFRSQALLLNKALRGEVSFGEQHRLAAAFVLGTAELLQLKQITTSFDEQ